MRIVYLFWAFLALPACLQAQDASFLPIRKGYKWGAIDTLGKLILPIEYDTLRFNSVSQHIYAVRAGKNGVFDVAGKEILPTRFASVQRFFQIGWRVSEENDKLFGIYNHQGKPILPAQYEKLTISFDASHLILATQNNRLGIADTVGKFVLPCLYDDIQYLNTDSARFFLAEKRNRYGLFAENGQEILPTEYDTLALLNAHYCVIGKRHKLGVYSLAQKREVLPATFREARILRGKNQAYYFLTQQDQKRQVWDITGKPLIRAGEYEDVVFDSTGVFRTMQAGLWGIASALGELPPSFDEIMPFVGNLAVVRKGVELGLINQAGEILLVPSSQPFEVRGNTIRRQLEATKTEVLKLNQAGKLIERDTYTNLKSVKIKKANEREINSSDYTFNLSRVDTARIVQNAITDSTFFKTQSTDWKYDVGKKYWTATRNGKKVSPHHFTRVERYPELNVFLADYKPKKTDTLISPNQNLRLIGGTVTTFFNLQTGKVLFSAMEGFNNYFHQKRDYTISTEYRFYKSRTVDAFRRNKYIALFFEGGCVNREGRKIQYVTMPPPEGKKDSVKLAIEDVEGFDRFGVSRFRTKTGTGLINADGQIVLPPQFNVSSQNNYWLLEKNGLYGLADSLGNMIAPTKYDTILTIYEEKPLFILQNPNDKFNLVSQNRLFMHKWVDSVRYMSDWMVVYKKGKYWQFTRAYGYASNKKRYEKLQDFSQERAWAVRKGQKKWGLINKSGRYWRVKSKIDSVQPFEGRFAIVGKGDKFGLMTHYARWFIKPQYTRIERVGETGFLACYQAKEQKYYLLNQNGKMITPQGCDNFQVHNQNYLTVENAGKATILTFNGKPIPVLPKLKPLPTRPKPVYKITQGHLPYDVVEEERQGFSRVMRKACFTLIDDAGKVLIEDLKEPFTRIKPMGKGIFYITQEQNEGYWHKERGWLWRRY